MRDGASAPKGTRRPFMYTAIRTRFSLSGEARFHLSGRDIEARTGDWFLVPKGEPHSYIAIPPRERGF